jgi:DNA modification methylase
MREAAASEGGRVSVRIIEGDSRDVLRTLPDASVHCCVTSPPYFGLRDYGVEGQMGLKQRLTIHRRHGRVFREVRRVLRDDGTLWLNIGDSYARTASGAANRRQYRRHHVQMGGPSRSQEKARYTGSSRKT